MNIDGWQIHNIIWICFEDDKNVKKIEDEKLRLMKTNSNKVQMNHVKNNLSMSSN